MGCLCARETVKKSRVEPLVKTIYRICLEKHYVKIESS